ncbi:ImmA/IrrE family metallo-endopeptidase [Enterococcus raffinosus]|uniref:ImmA/IrrE family metallo-endopeptidase n=1 Tax=Enterococcus raffinosus TaxID=71452 RepID=UPI0007640D63|nr:ImmA/IrrE family metallo-endopeptidase [Enterococcus raffinosus]OJG88656.1 hypothetical protein RV13_GL002066 [Enterococcus raffinosus]
MTKFEYQHVFSDEYNEYLEKANQLLFDISMQFNKSVDKLRYDDIINYFRINFNVHFAFFEADPTELYGDEGWPKTQPDSSWIKYKDTIQSADFCFLDSEIVDRISGVTIPEGNRTLILINQDRVYPRIIFTILHELCHFYFHIRDKDKKRAFISLTNDQIEGQYSDELIPFENEANIIGSILFCPEERLEYMLAKKYTFKDMCRNTGMSEPAMHNRLLNYFDHILKLPYYLALNYVWKFRKDDSYTRNLIAHKVKLSQHERKNQEKTIKLLQMQRAYVDKLQGKPFWDSILKEMNYLKDPIYDYSNFPKRYQDKD